MTVFHDLNMKRPLIHAILIFMSSLIFMLSLVEHEKSFITSGGLVRNTKRQILSLYEPRREKTGFLHMRKQRRRSASR